MNNKVLILNDQSTNYAMTIHKQIMIVYLYKIFFRRNLVVQCQTLAPVSYFQV